MNQVSLFSHLLTQFNKQTSDELMMSVHVIHVLLLIMKILFYINAHSRII